MNAFTRGVARAFNLAPRHNQDWDFIVTVGQLKVLAAFAGLTAEERNDFADYNRDLFYELESLRLNGDGE